MMNLWQILPVALALAGWLSRAAKDGEITQDELIEAAQILASSMGLRIAIPVSPPPRSAMYNTRDD